MTTDIIATLHSEADGLTVKADAIEQLVREGQQIVAAVHGPDAVPDIPAIVAAMRTNATALHAKADALGQLLKDGQAVLDRLAGIAPSVPPQQVGTALPIHQQLVAERGDPDATVVLPAVKATAPPPQPAVPAAPVPAVQGDQDVALPRPVDADGNPVCVGDTVAVVAPAAAPLVGKSGEVVNAHLIGGVSVYGVKIPEVGDFLNRLEGTEVRLQRKAGSDG